jgi:Family of unknown function (DUF6291)
MAENKKSFIAYANWKDTFDQLPNEEAGILIKHIFSYVNDENPISESLLINAVFANIKSTLKRDLDKWEFEIDKKSESGIIGNLKRWNLDLYTKFISKEITLEEASNIAKHRKTSHTDNNRLNPIAKIAVNDSVSVSVNDSVNVSDKVNVINKIYKSFLHLSITSDDFEKLKIDYEEKDILDCFDRIENYKKNTGYTSLYLTSKQWLEKEKKERIEKLTNGKEFTGKQRYKFNSSEAIETLTSGS